MQHVFFGNNRPPQPINDNIPVKMKHNLLVMEICNNWECVKELYAKIESGEVDLVNQLESTWIQFLSANKVNINDYKTLDEFEEAYIKN